MKKLLFLILVLAIAGAGIALYFWNKPHETVEDVTGQKITAQQLSQAFEADELKANRDYLHKVLAVSGTIVDVNTNQDGKTVLLLQGDNSFGGVQCTMKEMLPNFRSGDKVTIKGFCNGYTLVVLLSECAVE